MTCARSGTLSQICCAAWSHKHVLTGCWRRGDGICCTPLDLMGPGNLKLLSIQSESDWIESQLKIRMWHSCEKRRVRQWMGAQGQAQPLPPRARKGERGVRGGGGGAWWGGQGGRRWREGRALASPLGTPFARWAPSTTLRQQGDFPVRPSLAARMLNSSPPPPTPPLLLL